MHRAIRITIVAAFLGCVVWLGINSQAQQKDYRVFKHDIPEHKEPIVKCEDCHRRGGDDIMPRFPAHSACINCHVPQFVDASNNICLICHSDVKSADPPYQKFSDRKSFGTRFDSKRDGDKNQHVRHMDYPLPDGSKTQCTDCHQVKGASESFPAHVECYVCHTPGVTSEAAKPEISSCTACHKDPTEAKAYGIGDEMKPYATRAGSPAYRYRFTHATHNRYTRNQCNQCHTISAALQPRAPATKVHATSGGGNSCFRCHNDVRAFGENSFQCYRCHGAGKF